MKSIPFLINSANRSIPPREAGNTGTSNSWHKSAFFFLVLSTIQYQQIYPKYLSNISLANTFLFIVCYRRIVLL